MLELGLLYEVQVPEWESTESVRAGFLNALEQCELADQLGWNYVWAVEHHCLPGWSSSSAPEVFFGAVSQRTKNMRIGHGIALLPKHFNHPFRVAERVATLDLISGGRVELGTGRALATQELDGFDIDPDQSQAQWLEALEIIVQAFGYEPVTYKGEFYDIPPSQVVPKPLQSPHPPLWLAGTNPETFEKAGRHGLGMLAFLTHKPDEAAERIKIYRDAIKDCTPIGKFVNDRVALMVQTYCAETREQAYADVAGPIARTTELIGTLELPWASKSYQYLSQPPELDANGQVKGLGVADTRPIEQRANESILAVGDPDDLIRIFREWEAVGVNQLLNFIQFGGLEHDKIMNSLRLIGEHVIPEMRKAKALA